MSWSLGEIRALTIKAARGAGMEWGLADEAGYAVKWLQERNLPGVAAMCCYLNWRQNNHPAAWPQTTGTPLKDTSYCPIFLGAAYSDRAIPGDIHLSSVRAPLLMLPFIAGRAGQSAITVQIGEMVFYVTAEAIASPHNDTAILIDAAPCDIVTTKDLISQRPSHNMRIGALPRVPATQACCIKMLEKMAHKTYAPASDQSRLKGAGAGLGDND